MAEQALEARDSAVNVGALLAQAVDRGLDVDALEKLVALQERVMDRQAAMDFNAALAAFQAACPVISTNAEGHQRNRYATLDHIVEAVKPLMAAHGLSHSFDTMTNAEGLHVTCWIRHAGGHRESTQFDTPVGAASRGMNDQQAHGSALSYGKRYALCAALGLTTGDRDDDGAGAEAKTISEEQAADLRVLAEEVKLNAEDKASLFNWLKVPFAEYELIPEGRHQAVVDALERKRKGAPA
jgi:hypothetical protein